MNELTGRNITVQKIRCDNAGENVAMKNAFHTTHPSICFEFTTPATPQHNGICERAFATLLGKLRATFRKASLGTKDRARFWSEGANTVTKVDNITVKDGGKQSGSVKMFGYDPKFKRHLRTFGENAVIRVPGGKKAGGKLADRGIEVMFVGYADHHAGNVYRLFNPKTNKIVLSRDAV